MANRSFLKCRSYEMLHLWSALATEQMVVKMPMTWHEKFHAQLTEWNNDPISRWSNESLKQWISNLMNQWTNEATKQLLNESVNNWNNEPMNHSESMNEFNEPLTNEPTNQDEPGNQQTNEPMNQWTNEWMDKWAIKQLLLLCWATSSWSHLFADLPRLSATSLSCPLSATPTVSTQFISSSCRNAFCNRLQRLQRLQSRMAGRWQMWQMRPGTVETQTLLSQPQEPPYHPYP